MEIDKLFVSLALDAAKYSQGLSAAQQEGASWSQRMRSTIGGGLETAARIGGAAILGVGAIIGGVVASGTSQFIGFQNSMNEVFTLLPGISEDAMGSMSDDVLQFSKDFAVLPDKVVPALYQSLSAGVPPDNVFAFLETAQKMAVGGVTELETAVDGISSAVNAYGSDVLSAAQASDMMFTTVKLGKTTIGELSGALFNVAPTASSVGVAFSDITAQLAALTLSGTPTSVATTQIRAALVEASRGGTKLSSAIEHLTGSSFSELMAQGRSMPDVFEELRNSMPEQDFKDLFGSVEAMNAVLGVTGPNFDTVSAAMEQMENSAGATDDAYNQMNGGIQRTMDRFKAFASTSLIQVGDALSPIIDKGLELAEQVLPYVEAGITSTVTAVGNLINGLMSGEDAMGDVSNFFYEMALAFGLGQETATSLFFGVQNLWAQLGLLWTAVQPVVETIKTAVTQFVSWQDVMIAVGVILGGVLLSAIASIVAAIAPVIIAVGAIIAVIALLRNAWENDWGGIQGKVQAVIGFIVPFVQNAIAFIQAFWAENGEAILAKANEIWTAIVNTISAALNFIYNDIIVPTITALQEFWAAYGANIMAAALLAWNGITQTVKDAVALVKKIVALFAAAFQGDWETFGRLLVEIFFDAWQLLIDTAKNAGMVLLTAVAGIVLDVIALFQDTDWGKIGGDIIHAVVDGIQRAGGAIVEALKGIISNAIRNAMASLPGGGGGGGSSGAGYASGGFTGYGAARDVAGMVHRGEYVFSAAAVRNLGLANLDRLHKNGRNGSDGFTSGGGGQTISNDNSSQSSVMLINPKFNGIGDVSNFLSELEALAA